MAEYILWKFGLISVQLHTFEKLQSFIPVHMSQGWPVWGVDFPAAKPNHAAPPAMAKHGKSLLGKYLKSKQPGLHKASWVV